MTSVDEAREAAKSLLALLDNPYPQAFDWHIKVWHYAARINQIILEKSLTEEEVDWLKRMNAKADLEEERDLANYGLGKRKMEFKLMEHEMFGDLRNL